MRKRDKSKAGPEGEGKDQAVAAGAGDGPEPHANAAVEWVKSLLMAALLFVVLRSFLVQTFVITSGSMEDTLLVGDMLMVNRAAIGSPVPFTSLRIPGYSEPRRLDVLVFDPPHEETLKLVKRLIGLPGDTLQMRNRTLYINGVAQDEPYLKHADIGDETHPWMAWQKDHLASGVVRDAYVPTRDNWGPLVIPDDRYFMLGDNRETSLDSRYWGLLEGWRLEGRAVFIYYSYNKDSYRPFPWLREVRWGRIGSGIH
ncbi:MAG: signal peptidase I [Longimicrobiales bacterium]